MGSQFETVEVKEYHVTGLLYNSNKRFKKVYGSYTMAMSINLWNGSVWEVYTNGKRKLIKRVYN